MNAKSKSFIEDTLILLVIAAIFYGIFTFFFSSSNSTDNLLENQTIVEEKQVVMKEQKDEEIQKIAKLKEEIKEEIKKTLNQAVQEEEQIQIKLEEEKLLKEKLVEKQTEMTEKVIVPITIDALYKENEEKIYSNISKDIDKNSFENLSDVNIRVTILKDGKYEQLEYMSGSRQYYDLIKPSILKIFPLKIDNSLKNKFPRYFRMKVKYNN